MRKTLLALAVSLMVGCGQQTSEEHLAAAKQHLEEGDRAAAIVELKNAVQRDPQSAEARFELGKVYLLNNNFESAEKELNRALDNGYSATEVIPYLSQAYQRTGAYAALSELNHDDAGLSPTEEAKVSYYKIQSLVQLKKIDEARELIDSVEKLDTRSVYRGLSLAYRNIIDTEYAAALEEIEVLREQSPLNQDLLKLQGQLLLTQRKPQDAADVYVDYISEYPEDKQTKFVLAKLLVDSGKVAEAEPHVDELLAISPENALLNQLKGTIRSAMDDYENGQIYLEKAITNGRNDPVLRLIAGYAAYQQKDYESANRHLSFIASALPADHPGLRMLAASQLHLGQSNEAGEVLGRIGEVTEEDALLMSRTGYELIRSGNFKQAKELVERTGDISRSAEDLTRLGVLKLSLNDVQGIVDLEQAMEQSPELRSTKATLATAYLVTNQFDKAKALAQEWKKTAPDDVEPYLLEGEVLIKEKDYAAARQPYEQALKIQPDNQMARLALVNLEFLDGDTAKAEAQLRDLLGDDPQFVEGLASYYLLKSKQGEGREGLAPAERAVEANPQNIDARLMLTRMYLSEKMHEEALAAVNAIDSSGDVPVNYWPIKGQALLRGADQSQALAHYDEWLERYPYNKQAVTGKLLLLDGQNKFSDGLELTSDFLEQRDDPQMEFLHTHFLIMNGDFKAAREAFDALPAKSHELPFVQGMQSKLLMAEKEYKLALPLSYGAYNGLPNTRNLMVLVSNLERLDKQDVALSVLSNHVDQQPDDLGARMLLAERQISQDEADAIKTYEASLKLNPDNFVVLNNLAYLYMKEARLSEAKRLASRAVELRPEHPAALDTLAQILVREDDFDEALKYYERAISDKMRNEEIYLNYVETLLAADQRRLAQRKLDQRVMREPASQARLAELREKYGI